MRKCLYCSKVYLTDFKNCPICGRYTQSWEPEKEKANKEAVPQLMKRIISYLAHMGD